jgi:putative membrane protein
MEPASTGALYCGPAPLPTEIWERWNLDPLLILAMVTLAFLIGRRPPGAAAIAVLVIAFVSPLCALSAALFSARVVHHVLLIGVAAPLLALAFRPGRPTLALPGLILSTAALWLWHLPSAYDTAMSNVSVYWLMQVTLLAPAVVFWRAVLHQGQSPGRSIVFIWTAFMQMALLGALLAFAPDTLYAIHAIAPMDWGFTPLADQQLGGLIMWIPAAIPYLVIGALIARRGWLTVADQRA